MHPRPVLAVIAVVLGAFSYSAAMAQSSARTPKAASAFADFNERVKQYSQLQKAVPRLRSTNNPKELEDRRHALAQKIQELRMNAKQGDMFTPQVAAEIRRVILKTMRSPKASKIRKTIQQGEPQPDWKLTINGEYPERLPLTTMPPTLLRHLPELPKDMAYGLVGHDFVLQDTEARLVVDYIPGALP